MFRNPTVGALRPGPPIRVRVRVRVRVNPDGRSIKAETWLSDIHFMASKRDSNHAVLPSSCMNRYFAGDRPMSIAHIIESIVGLLRHLSREPQNQPQ